MSWLYLHQLEQCAAAGVQWIPEARFVAYDGETVKFLRYGREQTLRARFLIGADGARSTVAEHLGLDRNRDLLLGIEEVVPPISREATIGSRLLLTRTLPWDVVLADTAVLDVLMRIPAHLKLNAEVWNAAVARICTAAADVKNSNWGVTIGSSPIVNLSEFLWGVAKRKASRIVSHAPAAKSGLATTGSWPDYVYYMQHSEVLKGLWEATPVAHRDVLNDILGIDAWSLSLAQWAARDVNQWYRAMTLCLWLGRR